MTEYRPGLLEQIFNTIPLPIFLVDGDVRIYQVNKAASAILGDPERTFYKKRGGEVLHCLHASETPEGCGHTPSCNDCVIRNSVTEAVRGGEVNRKRTMMQLRTGTGIKEVPLLVTAAPFAYENEQYTLLVLEDISELLQLRSLLPICAWCKKIRNDENYWLSIEEYFGVHHDIDFSHGICDTCYKKMYPEKP
jgi:PAS domain-containing protein